MYFFKSSLKKLFYVYKLFNLKFLMIRFVKREVYFKCIVGG